MRPTNLSPILIATAVAICAAAPLFAKVAAGPVAAALAAPHRSEADKARDQYRHPAQTLAFFGLKPTMTVVEISPSGGWYTDILAPVLRDKGKLYAAHSNAAASPRAAQAVQTFKDRLAATPAAFDKVSVTTFSKDVMNIAPAGSADMVLTFRNVHNWYIGGFAPQAFQTFFKALKPGGVLGIEEHRLPEAMADAMQTSSGYMKVSAVRKLAEDAGFTFVAASKINANAKDTHDYPKGVWTLPPNYAEGETDKAKYKAIGESDRMTLKFVKPK